MLNKEFASIGKANDIKYFLDKWFCVDYRVDYKLFSVTPCTLKKDGIKKIELSF